MWAWSAYLGTVVKMPDRARPLSDAPIHITGHTPVLRHFNVVLV